MVRTIEILTDDQIQNLCNDVSPLFFQGTENNMNKEFSKELCRRRDLLRDKINLYLSKY